MGEFTRFLTSGFLALSFYLGVLFMAGFIYFDAIFDAKQYTFSKETVFEVSITEPEPEIKPTPEPPKPKEQEREEIKEVVEESASKTPKESVDIKNLFSEVEAPKPPPKEEKIQHNDDALAKRLKALEALEKAKKSDEAKKLVDGIKIQQSVTVAPTQGEFDEYYAKIHEMLMKSFAPKGELGKAESKVLVTVDNRGNFSFKIVNKSGNDAFDSYLSSYLDTLKQSNFPPYEKGSKTEIQVTFKTER